MVSFPVLLAEIHVLAGMNIVAPPCTSLTASPKVTLGDAVRDVHGGATIFIPANTWISATNTGKETIHLVFVFSAPGFNDFMRAESVPEGERVVPLTKAEDAAISAKHSHDVVYREP